MRPFSAVSNFPNGVRKWRLIRRPGVARNPPTRFRHDVPIPRPPSQWETIRGAAASSSGGPARRRCSPRQRPRKAISLKTTMSPIATHHQDEGAKTGLCLQVDLLAARVAHRAHHEDGDEQHQEGKDEGPYRLSDLSDSLSLRRKRTRDATVMAAAGTGSPQSPCSTPSGPVKEGIRDHVEAGQAHGGAKEVIEAEEAADDASKVLNQGNVLRRRQDKEEHEEGRRHPERDDVRERIELGAEQGLPAPHSRQPAVQHVEYGGAEDEIDRIAVVLGRRGCKVQAVIRRPRQTGVDAIARPP